MPTYHLSYGDQAYAVTLEKAEDGWLRAAIGDRTYRLRAELFSDGGIVLIFEDGRRIPLITAAAGANRWVSVNGDVFSLAAIEPGAARREKRRGGSGDLTAQMPGKIREVLVKAGDPVKRGEPLIILEAMKMELRVTAPADGVISRVLVQTGDVVERGTALIMFGEAD